mmetsp:Transcript_6589/g.20742  ORF Transcript_6589/g.20742 Transcript_6589/m.20742 type:complete len:328 (-) Transcript_6589:37-1020(-)
MAPKASKNDGISLLDNDEVAKTSAITTGEETLNLSGALDILLQIRDHDQGSQAIVQVESEPFMTDFFEKVQRVKQDLGGIRNNINEISSIHGKILTEVSQQRAKEHAERLDKMMGDTSGLAKKVKEALKQMDASELDQQKETSKVLLQKKIHKNVHASISRQFVELMTRYQDTQAQHKVLLREKLGRQYALANPGAKKEEVEAFIESGEENVFADKIMSKADQVALAAYQDVQSKHEELLRLETSIRELHQLFVDMAIMVEMQGELLDNIEESVSTTVQYTDQGVGQLEVAKTYQKAARKKMCFLVVCFCVLFLIALAWLSSFIPRI